MDDFERSGTLARAVVFRGVELPEGSQFGTDCDHDHFWVRLAAPATVHGHLAPSGSSLEFPSAVPPLAAIGYLVLLPLYPVLVVASLRDRARQRVVVTPAGLMEVGEHTLLTGERAELSKSGRLEAFCLRAPRFVRGLPFETGWLHLDQSGAVREVMLYRPQRLLGVPCFGSGLAGTEIRFHANGSLARLVLGEPHAIFDVTYPRGTRLDLTQEGKVRKARAMSIDVALYTPRPDVFGGGPRPP